MKDKAKQLITNDAKGFSPRSLRYCEKFYAQYKDE